MFLSPLHKSAFSPSESADGQDKVDMSLDDIIRLNKKQKQIQNQQAASQKQKTSFRGRLPQSRRAGGRPGAPLNRGGGVNKLFNRGRKLPVHRGQRVITGLAARKTAMLKGISPLNRPAVTRPPPKKRAANQNRPAPNRSTLNQRGRPFALRREPQRGPQQKWSYPPTNAPKIPAAMPPRPFRLRRKWNAPQSTQPQREARQATFLSRRGLKVHAHVQKVTTAPAAQRTRAWRSPQPSNGILKVSIDNPAARTQPEPAHSWSLHPTAPAPSLLTTEMEQERKPPKGVALQFDINSVGKQTSMTLNERFRILKDRRLAAAQQSSRGGRFVTVG